MARRTSSGAPGGLPALPGTGKMPAVPGPSRPCDPCDFAQGAPPGQRAKPGRQRRSREQGHDAGCLRGPVVAILLVPVPLVQAAWWSMPATRAAPLLVAHPGGRIQALCPRAAATGLRPGYTVAQGRLRCPAARVLPPDRPTAQAVWQTALRTLAGVSPLVEAADPDGGVIFLDAHGLERLVGDGAAVARRALEALAVEGIAAQAGAGPGRVVARALAARMDTVGPRLLLGEEARAFLHDLPIAEAALGIDPAVLDEMREVGITTAGVLAGLPEGSLGLRFGATAVQACRRARGAAELPLRPWMPAPRGLVRARLDGAVEDATVVQAVLARLAEELAATLAAEGRAAATLTLRLGCEDGPPCVQAGYHDPPLQAVASVRAAALGLWARAMLAAPVEEVALEADDLTTPVAVQEDLWGACGAEPLARRRTRLAQALAEHVRRYGAEQLWRMRRDPIQPEGWRREEYER